MKYLRVYIRPQDTVVFIDPRPPVLEFPPPSKKAHALWTEKKDISMLKNNWSLLNEWEEVKNVSPDYIVLTNNLHYEKDIEEFLRTLASVCPPHCKVIVLQYSALWKPVLRLAATLGISDKMPDANWVMPSDVDKFARLADFNVVTRSQRMLFPMFLPGVSWLANRWLSQMIFFRIFCLVTMLVLRPNRPAPEAAVRRRPSVSVVIPARNEEGNIEAAFKRLPVMGPEDELIFVEGNSQDNTWGEIQRCAIKYKEVFNGRAIKVLQQSGRGKKDAVYAGFAVAEKEILMILDADLTVTPEDLPKFYRALMENKGEFINGCRLIYPMENQAMRFLNMCANKFFAVAFSYVLGQSLKDTLCGTKVFTRETYNKIAEHREFFGDFDPFGDFDMIFGAARMGLEILEVPVHYKARTYGEPQISRFRDGMLLFRMLWFAARKLRFL